MATVAAIKKQVNNNQEKKTDIAVFVRNQINELGNALPSFISPERFVRVAVTSIRLNPKLGQCTQASLLGALFQAAQLGLEPNIEGQAYLIPYWNGKTKKYECQFQIGYKGYIELFYRHGAALTVDMHTVYENDYFKYSYGTSPNLEHCPVLKDRGEPIAYYAVVTLKNGGSIFKVMNREECIEHGKTHSKCYVTQKWSDIDNKYIEVKEPYFEPNSPWAKDPNAMCKKTVLIQLAKLMPKSVELQKALAVDSTTKLTIKPDMFTVPDETDWDEPEQNKKLPKTVGLPPTGAGE